MFCTCIYVYCINRSLLNYSWLFFLVYSTKLTLHNVLIYICVCIIIHWFCGNRVFRCMTLLTYGLYYYCIFVAFFLKNSCPCSSCLASYLWLLLLTWITLTPAWISNDMPSKVRNEITYSFPNLNGCTVEVWEWISNFTHTLYWM